MLLDPDALTDDYVLTHEPDVYLEALDERDALGHEAEQLRRRQLDLIRSKRDTSEARAAFDHELADLRVRHERNNKLLRRLWLELGGESDLMVRLDVVRHLIGVDQ